jgi:hypothetical protein
VFEDDGAVVVGIAEILRLLEGVKRALAPSGASVCPNIEDLGAAHAWSLHEIAAAGA